VLAVEWFVGNASSDTSPMWVQSHTSDWVWLLIFMRFLDHTLWRSTGGRTPLDEWSSSHRDLYLTTHKTNNTNIHAQAEFESTTPAGERPQTHALDRAATGTGIYIWQCVSSVAIVTRQWPGRSSNQGLDIREGQETFSCSKASRSTGAQPSSYPVVNGSFTSGQSGRAVKLTINSQLVQGLQWMEQ
jgi:hypothetical protein